MLRVLALTVAAGLLIVGCGRDDAPRAAATVEYADALAPLRFLPGDVEFGSEVWATHTVGFVIGGDSWIQHVSIHDRYVVDGGQLVPAPEAVLNDYTLSDQGPFGGSFMVEVEEPVEDEQRVSLQVAVSMEPTAAVQGLADYQPKEVTVAFDLVYHLWTEADEVDPGFRTVKELEAANLTTAQGLLEFLDCEAVGSYHHSSVNNAEDALSLARSSVDNTLEMKGHSGLVEAVPVRRGLWAILDSDGYVVGSVEQDQAIVMCLNEPPYYTPPTVQYLKPGEGDE